MRNGNSTCSGPEPTLVNLAVKEMFDTFWGGHLWVEVYFSPFAKRPGLQAVCENYFGLWRYAKLLGDPTIPYPGMGTLNSGGTGSPTQFMLDMEIRKSQFAMNEAIVVDEEHLPLAEIREAVNENRDFLASEHTLRHCRELWTSPLFLTDSLSRGWQGDEKAILDKSDQLWRENLGDYQPPRWPDDKIKALDDVLKRAKKEFNAA